MKLIFLFLALLHIPSLFAAQSDVGSSSLPLDPFADFGSSVNWTSLKGQNSQYVSSGRSSYRPGAATQNTSLRLEVDNVGSYYGWRTNLKISDEYSTTESWNYFDFYNAEISRKIGMHQITLGRHLENWSEWDTQWMQGEVQSRYMENGLRLQPAGLTGAFYKLQTERVAFTLAFLPVSIPDLGPHFTAKDNKLVSQNPWFHVPPDDFKYSNGIGDIHYSVANDEPSQVITNPGVATKLEYQERDYFTRLSFAYKPMPQLILGFPSEHKVQQLPNSDYMDLSINPRVVYSRVVNWDNVIHSGAWQLSGSVAFDDPVANRGPQDWTSEQVAPATIVAGSVSRRLEENGPRAARIEAGFLKINGGDDPDTGRFAGPKTLFARRFQFYEAYMLGLRREFRSVFYYPMETGLRVVYDREQGGGVISFSSEMRLNPNWRASLEMDFLGLMTSNAPIQDGFISTYRANDRVGVGATYVF